MQILVDPVHVADSRGAPGEAAPDYVAIVERAYRTGGSDVEWLADILEAARPALDEGAGIHAWFSAVSGPTIRIATPVVMGTPHVEALIAASVESGVTLHPREGVLLATAPPTASWLDCVGHTARRCELFRGCFNDLDVADVAYVRCYGHTAEGPVLAAWQPKRKRMHPRRRAAVERVARHVAAGYRLRHSLRQSDVMEAVIDPARGTVVHAEGQARSRAARDQLLRASHLCESARGPMRRMDPDRALLQWQELVAGRWSLVETVESDGRRLVLARPNGGRDDPMGMSWKERQVVALLGLGCSEKSIAIDLGLAASSVSSLVRSGLRKLGLASPTELLRLLRT